MIVKFNNGTTLDCISVNYITNTVIPNIRILTNVQDFSIIQQVLSSADLNKIEVFDDNNNLIGTYNGFTEYDFTTTALSNFTLDVTIILKQKSLQDKVNLIEQVASDTASKVDSLEKAGKINIESMTLDEYKIYKQELNKQALSEFLDSSYVEFNGKQYGVSEEDQNEMAMNLIVYQLYQKLSLPSILEWHAKKEQCSTFTEEDFTTLIVKIKTLVYPYVQHCQLIKSQIFNAMTKEEIDGITIDYNSLAESGDIE